MPTRWSEAAALRREQIESGKDLTFSKVFIPYYRTSVASLRPNTVLEIGCGTGHLSLDLQSQASVIVAIEPAPDMFAVATNVLRESKVILRQCRLEDVFEETFDLALAHLVIQMVADLRVFFTSLARVLHHAGRCVFSVPHPCFWNNYREYIPRDHFRYARPEYAEATLAITKDSENVITGVPYYHRPLQDYVKALTHAGLQMCDLDEVSPTKEVEELYGSEWKEPRYIAIHCERR